MSRNCIIIVVAAAAVIIVAAVTAFAARGHGSRVDISYVGSSEPRELIGVFQNREEAEAAAKLYGIRLERFNYGLAVFALDEGVDARTLIEKGKANGWPELSVNQERYLY
ncbi:MAG: hypothetical protein K6E88_07890 [Lachnospiraceae bacterium]|nr:hypothetical protein [Lachnospiraceae bacterium]